MDKKVMTVRHLLVTGTPGCGKTTLIKEAAEFAMNMGLRVSGFYTEEMRRGGRRIGFKIKTIPNKKEGILAAVGKTDREFVRYGKYKVFVKDFEQMVIPIMRRRNADIVVIDEIGGMELLSKLFGVEVKRMLGSKTPPILGTIQLKRTHLIYKWGLEENVKIIELHELTRKRVREEVREWVLSVHEQLSKRS